MERARGRGWRGKFRRKGRVITPGLYRELASLRLCFLRTLPSVFPRKVGMMLLGMGFDNTTSIYLASGKILRVKKNMAPLLRMFPLLQTKESLATREELAAYKHYLSRLADNGHAKTIKPDKRTLVQVLHNTSISWQNFKDQMQTMLVDNDKEGVVKEGWTINLRLSIPRMYV